MGADEAGGKGAVAGIRFVIRLTGGTLYSSSALSCCIT